MSERSVELASGLGSTQNRNYTPIRSYESTNDGINQTSLGSGGLHTLSNSQNCCNIRGSSVASDLIKSFVLGGIDGLFAASIIIAGAAGAGLSWQYGIIMGFSGILAGAATYGINEYLAFKNHKEYLISVRRIKLWEFRNSREAVIQQVCSPIYVISIHFSVPNISPADGPKIHC